MVPLGQRNAAHIMNGVLTLTGIFTTCQNQTTRFVQKNVRQ